MRLPAAAMLPSFAALRDYGERLNSGQRQATCMSPQACTAAAAVTAALCCHTMHARRQHVSLHHVVCPHVPGELRGRAPRPAHHAGRLRRRHEGAFAGGANDCLWLHAQADTADAPDSLLTLLLLLLHPCGCTHARTGTICCLLQVSIAIWQCLRDVRENHRAWRHLDAALTEDDLPRSISQADKLAAALKAGSQGPVTAAAAVPAKPPAAAAAADIAEAAALAAPAPAPAAPTAAPAAATAAIAAEPATVVAPVTAKLLAAKAAAEAHAGNSGSPSCVSEDAASPRSSSTSSTGGSSPLSVVASSGAASIEDGAGELRLDGDDKEQQQGAGAGWHGDAADGAAAAAPAAVPAGEADAGADAGDAGQPGGKVWQFDEQDAEEYEFHL